MQRASCPAFYADARSVRCDGVVVDVLGGLRRPRNKTFPHITTKHLPNVPLTDTALIARTDALVQWW
jgi:hypothetical protein